MVKRFTLLVLLLFLPAFSEAGVTQREWALQLVDSLGWSFGLPEKPTDDDYLRILNGQRTYRFEAEETHQSEDRVAVMGFKSFGKFSGEGWVNGTKDPTDVHLKFILPHRGNYRISARLRLQGHRLIFGEKEFQVDGSYHFETVEVGQVALSSGLNEVVVQLPPNGSIDYLELDAEPAGPIAPAGGWAFNRELSAEVAARTVIQALDLSATLPPGKQVLKLEAENLPLPKGVRVVSSNNRGTASGGRYVQVGAAQVDVGFYAARISGGVADVVLRAAGHWPITARLDGYFEARRQLGSRFEDLNLGTYFLPEGEMIVEVTLPAGVSLDRLELHSRRGSSADILRLVGLEEGEQVSERDMNNLLGLIARLKPR